MPYADQMLLFLLGGILSYTAKTIFGNNDIKTIKTDIESIKEVLIRNETMRDDIDNLKKQVEDLYSSRNGILLSMAKCPYNANSNECDHEKE